MAGLPSEAADCELPNNAENDSVSMDEGDFNDDRFELSPDRGGEEGSAISDEEHSDELTSRISNGKIKVDCDEESNDQSARENRDSDFAPTDKSPRSSISSKPAGLGSALDPSTRPAQLPKANGSAHPRQPQTLDDLSTYEAEENADETREKLQMIRVKFLRLAHRLGQTPHNVVVAQVLYRLGLAEQLRGSRSTSRAGTFSFDRARAMAEHLEASGHEPLAFSCTIMVIGKSGVGKSATINSIFDGFKLPTHAFHSCTKKVQEIIGTVQGITLRVIDTPGLSRSSSDHQKNMRILKSVKQFVRKSPPDIVLYLDRLDSQSRDHGDVPLLRSITEIFGASIWFNAIIVLTHAGSAPPEGNNGTSMSYEMFVTQRSHVVQQAIRQAAGDMRLMNPVSLVENHSACRLNRAGQRVLPNGQVWKPQLLLLSFASKILAEANELLKLQDSPPDKPFSQTRAPSLPFLVSSLIQVRESTEVDFEEFEDSDEESIDYDSLPPFKCLTTAQINSLTGEQRKAYYEELDYRERLLYKEERRRRQESRKVEVPTEEVGPASVPVPMADLALPVSFDSDAPSHRYRSLDSGSPWIVRPVLETQGWDHDVGYEGLNVERLFMLRDSVPLTFSGQLSKDKKDFNLQMELAGSLKHSEGKVSSLGFDLQTVGKEMAYTLRGETRFANFRRNSTAVGVLATILGDVASAGVKIEDRLVVSKWLRMVVSGGAMAGKGDVAYGGRMEAVLRDMDYPLGRMMMTIATSVVDWHGDLAVGCNVQSQIPVGQRENLVGFVNFNNRGNGQVGIRINSSEKMQIALVALLPILRGVLRLLDGESS